MTKPGISLPSTTYDLLPRERSGLFFDSFPTPPTGGYGVVAYGAGLIKSVGTDANGNPLYRQYHMDAQGSVLAITDVNGNLVTNYQIDAWGNVLSGGAPGNAFDYLGGLGYWADPDLGMHYVRARWMNPQTGSWLSVDPHLDEFAYQYANNMPTTTTDASGKSPSDSLGTALKELQNETIPDADSTPLADYLGSVANSRLSESQINLLLQHQDKLSRNEISFLFAKLALITIQSRSPGSGPGGPQAAGAVGKSGVPPQLRGSQAQGGVGRSPAGPGRSNAPKPPNANPAGLGAKDGPAPKLSGKQQQVESLLNPASTWYDDPRAPFVIGRLHEPYPKIGPESGFYIRNQDPDPAKGDPLVEGFKPRVEKGEMSADILGASALGPELDWSPYVHASANELGAPNYPGRTMKPESAWYMIDAKEAARGGTRFHTPSEVIESARAVVQKGFYLKGGAKMTGLLPPKLLQNQLRLIEKLEAAAAAGGKIPPSAVKQVSKLREQFIREAVEQYLKPRNSQMGTVEEQRAFEAMLKRIDALEHEFRGSWKVRVPRAAFKGLHGLGIALTVWDFAVAGREAVQTHSPKPVAKETVRQLAGWGGFWLGAETAGLAAGTAGIETGPFDLIITGVAGLLGGIAGYNGVDFLMSGGSGAGDPTPVGPPHYEPHRSAPLYP